MTEKSTSQKTAREEVREAFEKLGLQDKAGFVGEAALLTLVDATEAVVKTISDLVADMTKAQSNGQTDPAPAAE